MKTLPSLLIVADRGRLLAYLPHANGVLEEIEAMEVVEGLSKLSDLVTDKAGGFPDAGTMGQGNAAAERLTLNAELEVRALRKVAQRIGELLRQHQPRTWGFAAPQEIHEAILRGLAAPQREKLTLALPLDLTGMPPKKVAQHFLKANGLATAGR